MSLWSRIRSLFGAKMNRALDRMEDPGETLDYSYEKQLGLLRDVRRGLADIATSKQRLKLQAEKLREQDQKLQSQAERALMQGREDLARLALERKQVVDTQLESMGPQIAQLDDQQTKLAHASEQLQTRIESFRMQKESLKAQYTASSAQVRVGESFTGISREMNDIGRAVERAHDRIEQMQARSGALDELMESGALEDSTAQIGQGDYIDRQLAGSRGSKIDAELEAMKARLPGTRPQIESHE